MFLKFSMCIVFSFVAAISHTQVEMDKRLQLTGSGSDAKISGIEQVSDAKDATSAGIVQSGQLSYAAASGSSNAFVVSLSPAPIGYAEGMMLFFKANHNIDGPVTLNVNGLGAVPIRKNIGAPLNSCDIGAGQMVCVVYDGTNFQLVSPPFYPTALTQAGPDQIVFGSSIPLAATDASPGSGVWTIQAGAGGSLVDASSFNSAFSGALGITYTLRWTVTNECGVTAFDEVAISFEVPVKRVFVTASAGTGNLNTWTNSGGLSGLTAADRICQFDANNPLGAGNGNWKAWLSTTSVNAQDRIQNAIYKRADNITVIANNKLDLLDGVLTNSINNLNNVVFTGTNPAGNYNAAPFFSNPSPNASCNDWSIGTNGGTNAMYGLSSATNNEWTLYTFNYGCNPVASGLSPAQGRLYCFED